MKLLIADDNVQFRRRLASILSGIDGIEVVAEAGDFPGVIKAAEQMRPDTVLLDIHMPGGNWLDALARVVAMTPTPVVAMLAVGRRREYQAMFFLAGADYFFEKSSDLAKMIRWLKSLARKSRLHYLERG